MCLVDNKHFVKRGNLKRCHQMCIISNWQISLRNKRLCHPSPNWASDVPAFNSRGLILTNMTLVQPGELGKRSKHPHWPQLLGDHGIFGLDSCHLSAGNWAYHLCDISNFFCRATQKSCTPRDIRVDYVVYWTLALKGCLFEFDHLNFVLQFFY